MDKRDYDRYNGWINRLIKENLKKENLEQDEYKEEVEIVKEIVKENIIKKVNILDEL